MMLIPVFLFSIFRHLKFVTCLLKLKVWVLDYMGKK